jgi:hypothetical protein
MRFLRTTTRGALAGALLLALTACGGKSGTSKDDGPGAPGGGVQLEGATWSDGQGFQIVPTWVEGPAANAWSTLRLAVFDPRGEAAPAVEITEVKPWMSVHGHGAPVKKMTVARDTAEPLSSAPTHVWLVDKLFFTMSGDWELLVTATVAGATPESQVAELKVEVP